MSVLDGCHKLSRDMPGIDNAGTVSKGKESTKRRVGFYGCARQVIRLEDPSGEYPHYVMLQCPACGHYHSAKPAWRPWMEKLDKDREAVQL